LDSFINRNFTESLKTVKKKKKKNAHNFHINTAATTNNNYNNMMYQFIDQLISTG